MLKQIDSSEPSSGVTTFLDFLKKSVNVKGLKGIELGCGKGRNVIWLTQQGVNMTGIDFSPAAIKEARKRAKEANIKTQLLIMDATVPWKFGSNTFDVAIDCFATTDIETEQGRAFAVKQMIRVLRPQGYILVYVMSTDDEFHKKMVKESPANEKNAFLHPTTGKFEKSYDREELLNLYAGLKLIEEKRIEKLTSFFGKEYNCKHFRMVFQKA